MLSYEKQLEFKREVIVKAYRNFSGLAADDVPEILPTTGSPVQYGYRTKITPHFQLPSKGKLKDDDGDPDVKPDWLKIGFNQKGANNVLDIEECPIATKAINEELPKRRAEVVRCVL